MHMSEVTSGSQQASVTRGTFRRQQFENENYKSNKMTANTLQVILTLYCVRLEH